MEYSIVYTKRLVGLATIYGRSILKTEHAKKLLDENKIMSYIPTNINTLIGKAWR